MLAFLRHLGCPFCEKTVRNGLDIAPKYSSISFIFVTHATEQQNSDWLESLNLKLPSNVSMRGVDRSLYAAWGLGELGIKDVLGGSWQGFQKVGELRKEGQRSSIY